MEDCDDIIQIGNCLNPRVGFDNPQEGRIYSLDGICPTIRNDSRYWFLFYDDSADKC